MNEQFKAAVVAALKKDFFLEGDGHTVFKPQMYIDGGFPKEFVKQFTRNHESDGTGKGSLSDNRGNPMGGCYGVYNLEILAGVGRLLGCETAPTLGRGFQARAWIEAIKRKLDEIDQPPAAA